MFAPDASPWTTRLRRAAALVKAFALLEDAPRGDQAAAHAAGPASPSAPSGARAPGAPEHIQHSDRGRAHPHQLPLATIAAPRRPGAPPARPQPCTMPIVHTPRRVQRSNA